MLTNRLIPLAALFALLYPLSLASQPAPCPTYTASLSLNTGVDPTNSSLPAGSLDSDWTIIDDPSNVTQEPRPANVLTNPPLSVWATLPQSQWIGSQASANQPTTGDYFYQSCFCLRDGFSKASLTLDLRADDQVVDVHLNSTLTQIKTNTAPPPILVGANGSYSPSTPPDHLVYPGPFKFGQNCLIVRVRNLYPWHTGLDLVGSITAAGPNGTSGVLKPECCQTTEGRLKVCKVAGPGVAVGTSFSFTASSSTFTVPAGPAPGGTCVVGPSFPVGSIVTVDEIVPAGDAVSSITVAPPGQLVGTPNLASGSVNVTIGSGVTEVTYTDSRTGFLEICKRGDVKGNFTFYVNPGGLGPFVVPAGGCSPAIEVPAGSVVIHEVPAPGTTMIGCATIPASQQGPCNLATQNSTVTVAPGDISTQTIAFFTNRPHIPDGGIENPTDLNQH